MYVKLFTVWFLALVAFFVLWALLTKVVKHFSEKKQKTEAAPEKNDEKE